MPVERLKKRGFFPPQGVNHLAGDLLAGEVKPSWRQVSIFIFRLEFDGHLFVSAWLSIGSMIISKSSSRKWLEIHQISHPFLENCRVFRVPNQRMLNRATRRSPGWHALHQVADGQGRGQLPLWLGLGRTGVRWSDRVRMELPPINGVK